MDQNDYDELRKKGYTEEEIKVAFDSLSNINLSSRPMSPGREDRQTVVKDSNGLTKKTSSIMMGYNRQGIRLENGDYVSLLEFEQAIKESLESSKANEVYICKKTGKRVAPAEIVESIAKDVIAKQSSLLIEDDKSITNQTSARISIRTPHLKQKFSKGVLMIGNEGVMLPNGEYVFLPEIQTALSDYVKMKSKPLYPDNIDLIDDIPSQRDFKPNEEDNVELLFPEEEITHEKSVGKEKYRVIKRIKKKMSLIPIIVGLIATLLTGIGTKKNITPKDIVSVSQSIDFEAIGISEEEVLETQDEVIKRVASEIETGQKLEVQDGVTYHESSNYKYGGADASNEFGNDLRKSGSYNVDYISILYEGQIVQVELDQGKNLADVLEDVSDELGVSVSELEPMVHLGGPVSGWVSADDLYRTEELTPKVTDTKIVLDESESYNGSISDFNGDTIIVNNGSEDISLRVKDDDGNLIKEGSIVVGSDGKEYRMQKLKSEQKNHTDTILENSGTELTWSFHNIDKETALLAGAASIAATLLSRRKKKEMVSMTEEQIDKLVSDAKERFDKQSEFSKSTYIMMNQHPDFEKLGGQLIDHETTVEEIESIGSEKNHARK